MKLLVFEKNVGAKAWVAIKEKCGWKNGKIFNQNIKYLILIMCHRDVRNLIEIPLYEISHYAKTHDRPQTRLLLGFDEPNTLVSKHSGRISKQLCTMDSFFSKQQYILWQSQYVLHCRSQSPNTMCTMNARLPTLTLESFRSALPCRMSLDRSVK